MSRLLIAASLVALAAPAHAVNFHMQGAVSNGLGALQDPGIGANQHMVTTFDGGDALDYDHAYSSGYGLFTGNHHGKAAAPAGDTSRYMAISAGGSALFDLRSQIDLYHSVDSLSVYLGSVDRYNYIDILGIDTNGELDFAHPLFTLGGADLPAANGSWFSSLTNGRLTFDFGQDEHVGGIIFRSGGIAFEFDSIALGLRDEQPRDLAPALDDTTLAVPEPASWAMMVGGFGLMGGALRRRRVSLSFG